MDGGRDESALVVDTQPSPLFEPASSSTPTASAVSLEDQWSTVDSDAALDQLKLASRSLLDDESGDEENDNDDETGDSTTNAPVTAVQLPIHTWDGFVRQGTRLKTFLDDAMSKVKDYSIVLGEQQQQQHCSNNNKKRSATDNEQQPPQRTQRPRVGSTFDETTDHTAALAREKMAQVMQLQRVRTLVNVVPAYLRAISHSTITPDPLCSLFVSLSVCVSLYFYTQQLKDAQVQSAALQAANVTLREDSSSTHHRLERSVEALRRAGTQAQRARADAEAAEATAVSLAQTLQSLQTVVTETKRAAQLLHQEHAQIAAAAQQLEAKVLQKEGDLARSLGELRTLRQSHQMVVGEQSRFQNERQRLELSLEQQALELEGLKRVQKERDAMERARKERADKVEHEWRQAQALLVEATAGQVQAEHIKTVLEETVFGLRKANEAVHERLTQQQTASRKENERLSEALTKAEKEAQQLRIDAEATEEAMHRLRLDKIAADKQLQDIKVRVVSAERRLKELTNSSTTNSSLPAGSPDMIQHEPSLSTVTPATMGRSYAALPPLSNKNSQKTATATTTSNKENGPHAAAAVAGSTVCCLCFKPCFGMMKSCQCGKQQCQCRAHMSCVANRIIPPGPSVSHPGTPAPVLPLVLCGGVSRQN
jgi:hypothetical protein